MGQGIGKLEAAGTEMTGAISPEFRQLTTLPELIRQHLPARAGQVAFIEGDRQISYAMFDGLCNAMVDWLLGQGIGPGDRVAVLMVNRIEWLTLLFATARIGACLVPVNTRYRAPEVQSLLAQSEARLVVVQEKFRMIDFPALLDEIDPMAVPALEAVAILDGDTKPGRCLIGKAVRFGTCLSLACANHADYSAPDALAALFSTSGTTSGPKLVMHTQQTLASHSCRAAAAYGLDQAGACLLAALPFGGVFGLNSTLAAIAAGAPVIIMETFDGADAAHLMRQHQVTHTFCSDEMYMRIFQCAPGHQPFPSARLLGFAAFHPGAAEFARTAWEREIPLFGLYGSSELQALFAVQSPTLAIDQRIEGGGFPAAGAQARIRVRDVENDTLLAAGINGELEICAPTSFIGYFNNPAATNAAVDSEGFFRTGDIGRLRPDGSFVYETRRGDAMRLSGYLVNPGEIEDALKAIPEIADVQVVPLELAGEVRPVAFVIAEPGSAPSEALVIAAAMQRMARFKVPARIWFVSSFPTTESTNGTKIQRSRLRAMAQENQLRERSGTG